MIDFDLRDTLQDVLEQGRAQAVDRGVELSARMDPEVPHALTGDERYLRRALRLLLGHALSASSRGGRVELLVDAELDSEIEAVLHLEVRDAAPSLLDPDREMPRFGTLGDGVDPDLALWTHTAKLIADELGVRSDPEGGNVYWFRVGVLLRPEHQPQEVFR